MPTTTTGPVAPRRGAMRDDVLSLVHRATFGFTTEELTRARAMGFDAWRDEQLDPASIDDSALDTILASFPTLAMDAATLLANYPPASNGDVTVALQLRQARILRAAFSRRQLFERMVEFWTDHFNIDGLDGAQRYLKTVDDREVIREHALGNFRDLLGASAKSGAMLIYLDNFSNQALAPNENYSRELMELHTLGTGGAFDEADVAEVARCFTGWTVYPQAHPNAGEFVFRPQIHDNGSKTVLGTDLPGGGGQQDGETVLDLLASHKDTARRLANKLCVWFLRYDPPSRTVDRVARTFRQTGGDIRRTVEEVLSTKSFDEAEVCLALKLRRPMHLAVGAIRSTGGTISNALGLAEQLRLMGHAPFAWPAPNGYPDALGAWGSNLLPRWTFLSDLLGGAVPGAGVPVAALIDLYDGAPAARRGAQLSLALTGGRMSATDVAEVQSFLDSRPTFNGAVAREAVALALSLPSTQWI